MLLNWFLACTQSPGSGMPSPSASGSHPTAPSSESTTFAADPCPWEGEATIGPAEGCAIYSRDADLDVSGLTIEPGTTIELGPDVVVTVHRWLDAEGTGELPVVLEAAGDAWGGLDLDWDPDDATYDIYGSPQWDGVSGEWTLEHVTLRDAGAGRDAALVVEGGATFCGDDYCGFDPGVLAADGLVIAGSRSGGISALGASLDLASPIAFTGIAGYLLDLDESALDQGDIALDGGDNTVPAIRVHVAGQLASRVTWATQAVPLDFVDPVVLPLTEDPEYLRPWGPSVTIEPNTLRFAGGAGIAVDAGDVDASGVTFEALDPTTPWEGIRSSGDAVGQGYFGPVPVDSTLELDGCTVTGATSPAIDWASPSTPPSVTGTLVGEVAAAPGEDVCVSACTDLAAADLANTLNCTIPVLCP